MDLNLPKLIAHRGASRLAPENTLASLIIAHQLGARWVEFDLMLTADDVPIIFHDRTLDRTTNGKGKISKQSYNKLLALDAGSWFDTKFKGEKIPTLAEYLQTAAKLQMGLNIELKAMAGKEIQLAKVLLELLQQYWSPELPPPLISSFSFSNLLAVKALQSKYPLALIVKDWRVEHVEIAKSLNCYSIHVNQLKVTKAAVDFNTKAGLKTLAYTVNALIRAQELFAMGVRAIFSDVPDLLGLV